MNENIKEVTTRGVKDIIIEKDLIKDLENKKLRVKFGIDPTGPKLHIGRAIPLWKLRRLQDLGHQIVLIIGDFTGLVGDSSDKDAERPMLQKEEIEANMKGYLSQIGQILNLDKVEVHYNSEWLGKLNFYEIGKLADNFSVAEMIDRENFSKRFKEGKRISLREFLYPLMQGYDSVAIKADLEIGGSDQLFNLLAGRTLQKSAGQKPQNVMTFELLEGLDGRKMSTSYGNIVGITDEPNDQFGKIMSMQDDLIVKYFTLCTPLPMEGINTIKKDLEGGANPRDIKAKLAHEIVKLYHGEEAANKAEQEFDKVFKSKEKPTDIPEIKLNSDNYKLPDLLVELKLASSKGEARRLSEQGGIKINDEKITDWKADITPEDNMIIQVGKRRFVKIKLS